MVAMVVMERKPQNTINTMEGMAKRTMVLTRGYTDAPYFGWLVVWIVARSARALHSSVDVFMREDCATTMRILMEKVSSARSFCASCFANLLRNYVKEDPCFWCSI
mmetsp:Transcript_38785/g.60375  ORF Transcript_38785/g.60375 Transcript_38785/m.60375 type:complete len:106 (-) Transcript_38785:9-326(-)